MTYGLRISYRISDVGSSGLKAGNEVGELGHRHSTVLGLHVLDRRTIRNLDNQRFAGGNHGRLGVDDERPLVAVLLVGAGGLLVLVPGRGVPVLARTGLAPRLGDVEGLVFADQLCGDPAPRADRMTAVQDKGVVVPGDL